MSLLLCNTTYLVCIKPAASPRAEPEFFKPIATPFDLPHNKDVHTVIPLQAFKEDLMPISTIVTFQMLSYLSSIKRGINPDQPRNLAKSVTVE